MIWKCHLKFEFAYSLILYTLKEAKVNFDCSGLYLEHVSSFSKGGKIGWKTSRDFPDIKRVLKAIQNFHY